MVPGERPQRVSQKFARPPGSHEVPSWLRDAAEAGDTARVRLRLRATVKGTDQHVKRVRRGMHAHAYAVQCMYALHLAAADSDAQTSQLALLLWLEEMQQELDVRMYDIEGASMEATRDGRLLRLLVRTGGGQPQQGRVR